MDFKGFTLLENNRGNSFRLILNYQKLTERNMILFFFLCIRKIVDPSSMIWTIFLPYLLRLAAVCSEKNCNEILNDAQTIAITIFYKSSSFATFIWVNIVIELTVDKRIQRNERKQHRKVKSIHKLMNWRN